MATTEHKGAGGSRLTRVLTRLSEPGTRLPSVIEGGFDQVFSVLLAEIDETVLPRRVSLHSGARLLAGLILSNRRLIALHLPSQGALPTPVNPRAAAQLWAGQIREALRLSDPVRITYERGEDSEIADAVGCSALMLAKAAGHSLASAGAAAKLSDYFAVLESFANAWIYSATHGGDTRGGDAALMVRLADFAADARRKGKPRLGASVPECVILPLTSGLCLISARMAEEELFAFIPTSRMTQAINAWQKRF